MNIPPCPSRQRRPARSTQSPSCQKASPHEHRPSVASRLRKFLPFLGFTAFLWFVIRVGPKPSRAAYPCQRLAFPLASGFIVWVLALLGTAFAWRQTRRPTPGIWRTAAWLGLVVLGAAFLIVHLPAMRAIADPPPAHPPMGVAQGIFPGRVVWVHAPEATDWEGFSSSQHWWDPRHTDLSVVEVMLSQALQALTGQSTDASAWNAMFRHFHTTRTGEDRGYRVGEKITIKINLTTCNARSGSATVDPVTYEKRASIMNKIDNSPQMILALLRQLVYHAGVAPADIAVGDPTGQFPRFMYNYLQPEFPDVIYFDNFGPPGSGRTRTELSPVPFHWSTPVAAGKRQDYIPVQLADATYLINFPVLKGHSCGITICAKNHYGSLLRCPDGYLREAGILDYYNLHDTLADMGNLPDLGHYRALVDLMGHPELGGKTLVYLVDALFCGYYWDSHPYKWKMPPFGDGLQGDWPSSLFASLDPVAIDSVGYDFLRHEWPHVVTGNRGQLRDGPQDYLHEAALAHDPPSGTFYDPARTGQRLPSLGVHEHWNNPIDKQYSRNLGTGDGIELVALAVGRPQPKLAIHRGDQFTLLSWQGSITNLQLEQSSHLLHPISWLPVPESPTLVSGRHAVIQPVTDQQQFYRLSAPLPPDP
jgi:hypothetical protein